jgi:site-specific DNA recombinase
LIRSIAKAHEYYDAIKNGQTFEEIAESENRSGGLDVRTAS